METYKIKIPYVEIRNIKTLDILGIIEGAEIFFEEAYHGAGAFEIYCRSTPNSRNLLVKDNLVTLPNPINETEDCVWIIDKIEKTNNKAGGRYIVASGTEAKTILNRRIVRYATVLTKNNRIVDEVRDKLLNPNAIAPKDSKRKLDRLVFNPSTVTETISDTTQVTWDNLFDYTEALYLEKGIGAKLRIDKTLKRLGYTIYKGEDKSASVIFSQANENLLSSEYIANYTNYKTSVIVGGEEEKEIVVDEEGNETEVETGIRTILEIPSTETGYDRREVFIDAKDLQREYEDENGEKQKMSNADYNAALKQRGLEKKAEEHRAEVSFNGDIDITSHRYIFGKDYGLGDIVMIRDEEEKESVPVRVAKRIRVQNNDGYQEYFESEEVENVE